MGFLPGGKNPARIVESRETSLNEGTLPPFINEGPSLHFMNMLSLQQRNPAPPVNLKSINEYELKENQHMNEQQAQLAGTIVALGATITEAMDDCPGFVPCGTPTQVIVNAINALGSEDSDELLQQMQTAAGFVQHVAGHRGVNAHAAADISNLSNDQQQLAQSIIDFAAKANVATATPDEATWLYRSLASFEHSSSDAERR